MHALRLCGCAAQLEITRLAVLVTIPQCPAAPLQRHWQSVSYYSAMVLEQVLDHVMLNCYGCFPNNSPFVFNVSVVSIYTIITEYSMKVFFS